MDIQTNQLAVTTHVENDEMFTFEEITSKVCTEFE